MELLSLVFVEVDARIAVTPLIFPPAVRLRVPFESGRIDICSPSLHIHDTNIIWRLCTIYAGKPGIFVQVGFLHKNSAAYLSGKQSTYAFCSWS